MDLYGELCPAYCLFTPLGGDKRELTQREGDTVMGEQKKYWEGKHFAFYTNKECEYYPCHPVPEGTEFNCLFCYCPLYMLGRKCGETSPIWKAASRTVASAWYPTAGRTMDLLPTVSRRLLARWRNGRRRKDSKRRFQPIHSEMHMKKRPTAMRRRALFRHR